MEASGTVGRPAGSGRPVVAGVDGSQSALEAVRWAAAEAERRGVPLRLVSTYAWPVGGLAGDPGLQAGYGKVLAEAAVAQLGIAAETAGRVAPGIQVQREALPGFPTPVLQVESEQAELLVVGSRGLGGFTGLLIGSVAIALAAHAACPVVVVRGREPVLPVPEIVVGVDGTVASEAAVGFAFEAAALRGSRLVAVHTWHDLVPEPNAGRLLDWGAVETDEREVLAGSLASWREKFPDVAVRCLVLRDRPAHLLIQESHRAQLVVVGSRGRGGLKGMLLGSVSQALLRHAACPVAVVRSTTAQ